MPSPGARRTQVERRKAAAKAASSETLTITTGDLADMMMEIRTRRDAATVLSMLAAYEWKRQQWVNEAPSVVIMQRRQWAFDAEKTTLKEIRVKVEKAGKLLGDAAVEEAGTMPVTIVMPAKAVEWAKSDVPKLDGQ